MKTKEETKAVCDLMSFIAMVNDDRNAHVNLPKVADQAAEHYRTCETLFGKEEADHFKELLQRRACVCRMHAEVEGIASKWV